MRTARAVAVAVVVGLWAGPAAADSKFDEAYQKGQDAYNLGKLDEAWEQFERARQLAPDKPGPYRWLGLVAKEQKRWRACIENFVAAMRINPKSSYGERIRAELAVCRRELGHPSYPGEIPEKQGAVAVIANVEGASVELDGIKKGATPLSPFPANPGKHKLKVSRRGYFDAIVEIDVVEGIVNDVEVTLEPDPDAKLEDRIGAPQTAVDVNHGWLLVVVKAAKRAVVKIDGRVARASSVDGTYQLEPGIHTIEIEAEGYEPWRRRVVAVKGQKRGVTATLKKTEDRKRERRLAYLALGAAAAAGTSGAVFGFLENKTFEEVSAKARLERLRPATSLVPDGLPEAEIATREEIEDLTAKGKRYALVSNVSYGVALLSLGVSVYYFVKERGVERKGFDLPMALVPTGGEEGRGAKVVFYQELDW